MTRFSDLPFDTTSRIFGNMELGDLARLSATSKDTAQRVNHHIGPKASRRTRVGTRRDDRGREVKQFKTIRGGSQNFKDVSRKYKKDYKRNALMTSGRQMRPGETLDNRTAKRLGTLKMSPQTTLGMARIGAQSESRINNLMKTVGNPNRRTRSTRKASMIMKRSENIPSTRTASGSQVITLD